MNGNDLCRRKFLKAAMGLSVVCAVGWDLSFLKGLAQASTPAPEAALRKLILVIGPWKDGERARAEDFARRFLASGPNVAPYLPGSAEIVQGLAARFPDSAMALQEIDLKALPAKERELVEALARQLYSFVEVRFHICGEPDWGECQTGRERYTKPPG